jgi:hypothetical protein
MVARAEKPNRYVTLNFRDPKTAVQADISHPLGSSQ